MISAISSASCPTATRTKRPTGSAHSIRSSRTRAGLARAIHPVSAAEARAPAQPGPAAADLDALHQHHLARAGAGVPGRRGDGAAHPAHDPLERGGDGPARECSRARALVATSPPMRRRPPCTKSASTTSSGARTPTAMGDQVFFQGHAAPGIYARAFLEGRLTEDQLDHFRQEVAAGSGPVVLSAPAADARLLGVPDGLDGPRSAGRDLPGALQSLPPAPRHQGHLEQPRVGLPGRRRDRRAGGDGLALDRRA